MKLFDSVFSFNEQVARVHSENLEVIARNIANADTPGYKAREIDFTKILNTMQSEHRLKSTHVKHIEDPALSRGSQLMYTVPFNTSMDGNTVEISVQQAKYGKAAARYQATLGFIESDVSGIRKALRGD